MQSMVKCCPQLVTSEDPLEDLLYSAKSEVPTATAASVPFYKRDHGSPGNLLPDGFEMPHQQYPLNT